MLKTIVLILATVLAYDHTDTAKIILRDTNAARAKNNLSPLRLNTELCQAARVHANHMAERRKLSHTLNIPGFKNLDDRLRSIDYKAWTAIGENIAEGYQDKDVVNGWMNSPGHRRNILGNYNEIGIGVATDSQGTTYHCQVFGERSQPVLKKIKQKARYR